MEEGLQVQGAFGHAIHQRISDKRPHRIVTPSIDGQHQAATLPNLLDVVGANFIIANRELYGNVPYWLYEQMCECEVKE